MAQSMHRNNKLASISAMLFIAAAISIPNVNTYTYVGVFSVLLLFLCINNFRRYLIGFCIFGAPFILLVQSFYNISVTKIILGVIAVQVFVLLQGRKTIRFSPKFFVGYGLWLSAVFVLILIGFYFSPKSYYTINYTQYFIIYTIFYCLAGLIIVQSDIKIEEVLLPGTLFFICIYPLFGISLLNIPANVFYSSVGLRTFREFDSIGIGRIAGCLSTMAVFSVIKNIGVKKNKMLFGQIALALTASLPILWYSQLRQGVIALGAVILLAIWVAFSGSSRRAFSRNFLLLSLLMLTLSGFLYFMHWANLNLEQARTVELIDSSSRIDAWQAAWGRICANPIAGYGLGGFYSSYSSWPHNWILESWHDYGVFGLLLFGFPVFRIITNLFYSKEGRGRYWLLVSVFYLVVMQFSCDIARNTIIFLFFSIAIAESWVKPNSQDKYET